MAFITLPNGRNQFFDDNGDPLVGGLLHTYDPGPGITTPKDTYADAAGGATNTNPIILDARGEATIFWNGGYNVRLEDAQGGLIWTVESINTDASASTLDAQLRADLLSIVDPAKGAGMVGYDSALSYPANTVGAALLAINENGFGVNVFDYMTDAQIADVKAGSLTLDVTAAVLAAHAASQFVYFPAGWYRLSTLTLSTVRGLIWEGEGASLLASGTHYLGNTVFSFDNATAGTDGLVIDNFVGIRLENIVFSMRRGGAGGGTALKLTSGHDGSLKNIAVDLNVGSGGEGIVMGGGGGATSTFIMKLSNVKVMSNTSRAIHANFGTSHTWDSVYQIGGWLQFTGMGYCTINSCATENAPLYGYIINGCSSMTFNACGSEQNGKGGFYLSTTTTGITINSPYGAANNTSADATVGDLIHIDSSAGAVSNIVIDTPVAVAQQAASTQNIYANAGTLGVIVQGVNASFLAKGINGNSTWKANYLTVYGDGEVQTWTPTLGGVGWTLVGFAGQVGKFVRHGKTVSFYVVITPGTSIQAAGGGTSYIDGLPFGPLSVGQALQTDGNNVSYGAAGVSSVIPGRIYAQATGGAITTTLSFTGTFITN